MIFWDVKSNVNYSLPLFISRARSVCRSGAENEKSDYFTDTNYPESFFQNSTAVEKMLKDPDAAAKLS